VTSGHQEPNKGIQMNEAIDFEDAIAALDGDEAAFAEIAQIFMEEVHGSLDALSRQGRMSDPGLLMATLHELANSLGVVGARQATAFVRSLEHELFEGQRTDHATVAVEAAVLLEGVAAQVRRWLAQR
jgi:HPt (histidine-containing phosphotransfer) domain-containing protein